MFFIFGLELGDWLGLCFRGPGHSLGVDISRGQGLHVDAAPGDQPVRHVDEVMAEAARGLVEIILCGDEERAGYGIQQRPGETCRGEPRKTRTRLGDGTLFAGGPSSCRALCMAKAQPGGRYAGSRNKTQLRLSCLLQRPVSQTQSRQGRSERTKNRPNSRGASDTHSMRRNGGVSRAFAVNKVKTFK